ncbi:MAG: hypothetical protein K0M69_06820 [Youngiibacter sp.]|nr:hypothetical protein [Youngiibacter sp.]
MNKKILEALTPLGVPVKFQKHSGAANQYITFHEYFQTGEAYDDDVESLTGRYFQVDIWSKTDYEVLVIQVKSQMKNAGFTRIDEADLYESDTRIYHKALRYYYLEEREG